MIQARMSAEDSRLYSPNRDVAHNFDYIVKEVGNRMVADNWPFLSAIAKSSNVTRDDLADACQCLHKFVLGQLDVKREGMGACLERCGFFALPEAARVIVMAHLGAVILGVHWAGVHEATFGGVGPLLTYQDLADEGRRCAALLRTPKWRRKLYTIRRRVKDAWQAITNKPTTR